MFVVASCKGRRVKLDAVELRLIPQDPHKEQTKREKRGRNSVLAKAAHFREIQYKAGMRRSVGASEPMAAAALRAGHAKSRTKASIRRPPDQFDRLLNLSRMSVVISRAVIIFALRPPSYSLSIFLYIYIYTLGI